MPSKDRHTLSRLRQGGRTRSEAEHLVRRKRGAAAADGEMDGALAGVDRITLRVVGIRCQRVGGKRAPNRVGAFVVVLVSADHDVDVVAVEQWQPVLPNAEVCTVDVIGGRYSVWCMHTTVQSIAR